MGCCSSCGRRRLNSHSYCVGCLKRRRPKDRARRQAISSAKFSEEMRARLLELLTSGVPLSTAGESVGVSCNRVFGYRRFDSTWGKRLDEALTAGGDPSLAPGAHAAHRWGGCRCPECRAVKALGQARMPALMPPRKKVAPEQQEVFLRLLEMGAPMARAAEHAGVRVPSMRRLRERDAEFGARWAAAIRLKGRPALLSPDPRSDRVLRAARAEGESNEAIGELLGVSGWAVSQRAVELGLSSGLPVWPGSLP